MAIHIEGRRWFQRTYGNTYHSVTIYKDGEPLWSSGRHYGYGEQYLQTAWGWLVKNGYTDKPYTGTLGIREGLGASYSVADVRREKDL